MKIILLEKIKNFGNKGDVIEVKNGYARNFLFPFNKAIYKKKFIYQNKLENNFFIESNNLNNITVILGIDANSNGILDEMVNSGKLNIVMNKLNLSLNKENFFEDFFIKKTGVYQIEIKNKKNNTKFYLYLLLVKLNEHK